MEHTPMIPLSSTLKSTSENSPIFGLYYLEEQELDLNEVVGCFGASSVDGPIGSNPTYTCPGDDYDDRWEPIG